MSGRNHYQQRDQKEIKDKNQCIHEHTALYSDRQTLIEMFQELETIKNTSRFNIRLFYNPSTFPNRPCLDKKSIDAEF